MANRQGINQLLDQLYTLQSSTQSTDFLEAAELLMARRAKRALVILISNVQPEDSDDLRKALKVLSRRHAVMLANLKEQALVSHQQRKIENFDDALYHATATEILQGQAHCLDLARQYNTWVVDSLPRHMHRALSERYVALKRAGSF